MLAVASVRPEGGLTFCEAEAAYGILAAHPLFFEHMKEEEAGMVWSLRE